jgi:hypothetical protein
MNSGFLYIKNNAISYLNKIMIEKIMLNPQIRYTSTKEDFFLNKDNSNEILNIVFGNINHDPINRDEKLITCSPIITKTNEENNLYQTHSQVFLRNFKEYYLCL